MKVSPSLILLFSLIFISSTKAQKGSWHLSLDSGLSQIPSFTSVYFENEKPGLSLHLGGEYSKSINKILGFSIGLGLSHYRSKTSGAGFYTTRSNIPEGYGNGNLTFNNLFATLPIFLTLKSSSMEFAFGPESLFQIYGWGKSQANFTAFNGGINFDWDKTHSGNHLYLFYNVAIAGKVAFQIKERLNIYCKYSQSLFDAFEYSLRYSSRSSKELIRRLAFGLEINL